MARGGNELFTFTVVAPEAKWNDYKGLLEEAASSFCLLTDKTVS